MVAQNMKHALLCFKRNLHIGQDVKYWSKNLKSIIQVFAALH